MELGYVVTFVGGLFADLLRRILLPESERWLDKIIPARRIAQNRKDNLRILELQKLLKDLEIDPNIAAYYDENAKDFFSRINIRSDAIKTAYKDVVADSLGDKAVTQADMTQLVYDRFAAADRLLQSRFIRLTQSTNISQGALTALFDAQAAFEKFRKSDALLEATLTAEGGSMEPMIKASAMESATIARLARIDELETLSNV